MSKNSIKYVKYNEQKGKKDSLLVRSKIYWLEAIFFDTETKENLKKMKEYLK